MSYKQIVIRTFDDERGLNVTHSLLTCPFCSQASKFKEIENAYECYNCGGYIVKY